MSEGMSMIKLGLACVYCVSFVFSCLGLLSCIELCIFGVVWFCLLVR